MEIIRNIIKALSLVEVKGPENMDRLLGSIQALEKLDKTTDDKLKELKQNDNHDEPKQDVRGAVD